jgi:hypothetical protein
MNDIDFIFIAPLNNMTDFASRSTYWCVGFRASFILQVTICKVLIEETSGIVELDSGAHGFWSGI